MWVRSVRIGQWEISGRTGAHDLLSKAASLRNLISKIEAGQAYLLGYTAGKKEKKGCIYWDLAAPGARQPCLHCDISCRDLSLSPPFSRSLQTKECLSFKVEKSSVLSSRSRQAPKAFFFDLSLIIAENPDTKWYLKVMGTLSPHFNSMRGPFGFASIHSSRELTSRFGHWIERGICCFQANCRSWLNSFQVQFWDADLNSHLGRGLKSLSALCKRDMQAIIEEEAAGGADPVRKILVAIDDNYACERALDWGLKEFYRWVEWIIHVSSTGPERKSPILLALQEKSWCCLEWTLITSSFEGWWGWQWRL